MKKVFAFTLVLFAVGATAAQACRPILTWGPYTPPVTTPSKPTLPPPIISTLPNESYCVQTVEAGETFIQANFGSFEPGGDWYGLVTSGAQVILDGHVKTLQWENGKGVILAANVPGVGLTCDQPYVTTDGVYADPSYGER